MKILVQIIYIIITAATPSLAVAVLLLKPEARGNITAPMMTQKAGRVDTNMLEPTGGYWSVVLMDSLSNRLFKKVFRRRLLIGRRVDNQEYTGVLFLDTDSAISRKQCELAVTSEGIILNNLSSSNTTLHNGTPVSRPVLIRTGDDLTIAGHHYVVQSIRPEPSFSK